MKIMTVFMFVLILNTQAHAAPIDDAIDAYLAATMDKQSFEAQRAELLKQGIEQVRKDECLARHADEIEPAYKDIAVKHFKYEDAEKVTREMLKEFFTEAQIKDITAFYTSETGKKLVELSPKLAMRQQQALQSTAAEATNAFYQILFKYREPDGSCKR